MTFERVELYLISGISYLKDPTTTKSWENHSAKFSIVLGAKDLEDALALCREWARTIPVQEVGYHNSEWVNGEFSIIESIERKGEAYIPRRRKAE